MLNEQNNSFLSYIFVFVIDCQCDKTHGAIDLGAWSIESLQK